MTDIKTIFFDLDDTLVDNQHAKRAAMEDTFTEFRAVFHMVPLEVLNATFDKVNDELWSQLSKGRITADEMITQRFLQTLQMISSMTPLIKYDQRDAFLIDPFFAGRFEFHTHAFPEATETLHALRNRFTIGLLTNGLLGIQTRRLQALGWSDMFNHIITPDTVGAMKPDEQIFQAAEKAAQCAPHEIAFVGDSHHYDVAAAKRRGWHTVWFNPANHDAPDASADAVVASLRDVATMFLGVPA